MKKKRENAVIIFTDLDATLLDHETYDWKEAGPSIEYCRQEDVPVILVSSKTRAEMREIHREMKLDSPFVSENGGGIFFPLTFFSKNPGKEFTRVEDLWKLELGPPYEVIVKSLKQIKREQGLIIRGFSSMNPKEVAQLTGLSEEDSAAALSREFDEPFILLNSENVDTGALKNAADRQGLTVTQGGRFFHLHGSCNKGKAVERLISLYRERYNSIFSIALGDSPNDFSMFQRVDQPVLVRSNRVFPEIESQFPGIMITDKPGPKGWNLAVSSLVPQILNGGFPNV